MTYECRYCDDVCIYNGKELWNWQEFCSKACFMERWTDVNEYRQALLESIGVKKYGRVRTRISA
jgi:hypothetical protein